MKLAVAEQKPGPAVSTYAVRLSAREAVTDVEVFYIAGPELPAEALAARMLEAAKALLDRL